MKLNRLYFFVTSMVFFYSDQAICSDSIQSFEDAKSALQKILPFKEVAENTAYKQRFELTIQSLDEIIQKLEIQPPEHIYNFVEKLPPQKVGDINFDKQWKYFPEWMKEYAPLVNSPDIYWELINWTQGNPKKVMEIYYNIKGDIKKLTQGNIDLLNKFEKDEGVKNFQSTNSYKSYKKYKDTIDTIGIKPEEYGVISGDLAKIYQKLIVENKEQMAMADIEHVKNNLTIYRASGNYKNIQN